MRLLLPLLLLAVAGCPHDFPRVGGDGTVAGDYSLHDGIPVGCGDGKISDSEVCDGIALNGKTCKGLGFSEGTLACAWDCRSLDTNGCLSCGIGAACSTNYWLRGVLLPGGTTSISSSYTCTSSLSVSHSADTSKSTNYELAGHVSFGR